MEVEAVNRVRRGELQVGSWREGRGQTGCLCDVFLGSPAEREPEEGVCGGQMRSARRRRFRVRPGLLTSCLPPGGRTAGAAGPFVFFHLLPPLLHFWLCLSPSTSLSARAHTRTHTRAHTDTHTHTLLHTQGHTFRLVHGHLSNTLERTPSHQP